MDNEQAEEEKGQQTKEGLPVEETPLLEPIGDEAASQTKQPESREETPPEPPAEAVSPAEGRVHSPRPSIAARLVGFLGKMVFFFGMFAAGVWISTILQPLVLHQNPIVPPTPSPAGGFTTTASPTSSPWKTYRVLNGTTKLPVEGVTYQLPAEVAAPTCDGANCASQGTYLPGGTRFTVAARGKGQALPDYRGKVVSDLLGQAFRVQQTTVGERPALAFTAEFAGVTIGGYRFTAMRGVMVEVSDTLSVEINHFTPSGSAADFAADEELFEEILTRVTIQGGASVIPAGTAEEGVELSTPSGAAESPRDSFQTR